MALDLDRHGEALPVIRREMEAISDATARSEAVTDLAREALRQNDAAIADAGDPVLRMSLIADKLLVVRNFAGAVGNKIGIELGDLGLKSWQAFKEGLPQGVGVVGRFGPLIVLGTFIAGPIGGIAMVLPAFKSAAKLLSKIVGEKPAPKKATRKQAART